MALLLRLCACREARSQAHLQVVILAHALVAGGLDPEEVPEVDLHEVAVLRGDDPGAKLLAKVS